MEKTVIEGIEKFLENFNQDDKDNEGIPDCLDVVNHYKETFKTAHFYRLDENKGFIIVEQQEFIGGFHIYIDREFRNYHYGKRVLKETIELMKGLGIKEIFTLARGKNAKILTYLKIFEPRGEYKGFTLYKLCQQYQS